MPVLASAARASSSQREVWASPPPSLYYLYLCALSPRTDRGTVYVRLYQRGLMDRAYGASVRRACVCVAVCPG